MRAEVGPGQPRLDYILTKLNQAPLWRINKGFCQTSVIIIYCHHPPEIINPILTTEIFSLSSEYHPSRRYWASIDCLVEQQRKQLPVVTPCWWWWWWCCTLSLKSTLLCEFLIIKCQQVTGTHWLSVHNTRFLFKIFSKLGKISNKFHEC